MVPYLSDPVKGNGRGDALKFLSLQGYSGVCIENVHSIMGVSAFQQTFKCEWCRVLNSELKILFNIISASYYLNKTFFVAICSMIMIKFLNPIEESGCSLKWQIKRLYWSGVRN